MKHRDETLKKITDWSHLFGTPIAMIEENESCFEYKHAMKMVLYDYGVKVDFKLFSATKFWEEVHQKELPEDWDIGYRVYIIKKPSQERFKSLLNDFWWDTTHNLMIKR